MATSAETRVVNAAGVVQGIALVTFPAASTILTDPDEYDLSSSQYGALFLPQVVTAIVAALLGASLAGRFGTKRVYLAGLCAGLASMTLLLASAAVAGDSGAYPLLLLATATLGAGFGLTVPVLNTLTADFHPDAPDRAVLVLNALLGFGTVLAPVFVAIFDGLGAWWGLPLASAILLSVLVLVSVRLPLEVRAARATPSQAPRGIPSRFWVYAGFAVLYGICETVNGNWAQLDMTDLGSSTTAASLALTAFWGMVTLGRILFAAIEDVVPLPADVPRAPARPCGRLRARRTAPGRSARVRHRRVRPRRARVLGAPAADDQLRPERALDLRGGRGGRRDRLLPARVRHRRVRRGAASGCRGRAVDRLRAGGDRGDRDVRLVVRRRRPSVERALRRAPRIGSAMNAPSGEQVEIAYGDQRAVVVEVGGGLRTYSAGGRAVLDGYGPDEMSRSGRGQVLIPWPNRLEDGSYEFDGRRHQAPIDDLSENAAIHGLVRWAAWTARRRAPESVVMEHLIHPRPGYPFSLALRIEYTLSDSGLTVTTTATNVGADPCPYGSGAHPYLTLGTEQIDSLVLRAPGATVLSSDERGLPTGRSPVEGTEYDFRRPRPIGATRLDSCFTDLERGDDGRARVELTTEADDAGVTLWTDEQYGYLMLFTGDPLPDVARRSLAVEPMTCPPNAFRTGEAVIRLEPGQSVTSTWGITPRHAAA